MPEPERNRAAEILLVEDNSGDIRLIQEAFKEVRTAHRLSVVQTGESALQFLRRQDGYANAPHPDLVLLDLHLPDLPGLELLALIKSDPALRRIPTVVFSSSHNRREVFEAYNLNANSYIRKPIELEDFIRIIKGVEEFWLMVVKLPKE